MTFKERLKTIDWKGPRYVFPLILIPGILIVVWQMGTVFGGSPEKEKKPATDSLNLELPEAQTKGAKSKYEAMQDLLYSKGGYSALEGIEKDGDERMQTDDYYSEAEKNAIDSLNALQKFQEEQMKAMQRLMAENSAHDNAFDRRYQVQEGGGVSSRQQELDQYAQDIAYIRKQSRILSGEDTDEDDDEGYGNGKKKKRKGKEVEEEESKVKEDTVKIVTKAPDANATFFNTIDEKKTDEPLIKAMMDETLKVVDGTRIRLKLLDDVIIEDIKIKKGAYLYATVTGFSAQRVKATVTSILIGDKFQKVNLSVFDNDGMEGFYVPMSQFRDLMKQAGSSALQGGMMSTSSTGNEAEMFALQALQQVYQSTTSAISNNIKKNKARIKYNTVVYLINTEATNKR